MRASQFLQGYNVYEFTFKNSSRIHYAIAKNKKSLIEYYSEDITDPILKNDIKIDDSLSFADVIPTEKKHGYFSPAKKLEEYLYDFDIYFNDSENSNNKGFSISLDEAKSYIEKIVNEIINKINNLTPNEKVLELLEYYINNSILPNSTNEYFERNKEEVLKKIGIK